MAIANPSVFRPQGVDTIPVYCDLTSLGLLKGKLAATCHS